MRIRSVHTHSHICTHLRTHSHTRPCTHTHTHTREHTHTHTFACTHTHTLANTQTGSEQCNVQTTTLPLTPHTRHTHTRMRTNKDIHPHTHAHTCVISLVTRGGTRELRRGEGTQPTASTTATVPSRRGLALLDGRPIENVTHAGCLLLVELGVLRVVLGPGRVEGRGVLVHQVSVLGAA